VGEPEETSLRKNIWDIELREASAKILGQTL